MVYFSARKKCECCSRDLVLQVDDDGYKYWRHVCDDDYYFVCENEMVVALDWLQYTPKDLLPLFNVDCSKTRPFGRKSAFSDRPF